MRDDGVPVTVLSSRTTTRNVPCQILDLAGSAGADMLVVGNSGHGSVVNFLLGSVATQLLRLSPLPILTVPSVARAQPPAEISHGWTAAGARLVMPHVPLGGPSVAVRRT
ncbi:hypothetical protein GCM10020358_59350 [Amorphoplanes nipponensis]|uniref:UspA domain-containing protein n=1 Tax=Actinoplanes nipponensis TaxID=135950 RepID=A0A919MJR1_9ACTN|nr:hypothetical protein Ani05nite_04460 [Actinoplanes nipponensis]